ncbi:hypothetical protein CHARACLAT_017731 [Characodon lateralis]|uniref:Growth hormone/erythropoietin receptor ligand binding domain-containing protein n=1 Tax=Characodon lateralis TaxID=208331 RepID=A0ABU7EKK7_9TELE|nr:hypothetical protein [Characodon lateralis]
MLYPVSTSRWRPSLCVSIPASSSRSAPESRCQTAARTALSPTVAPLPVKHFQLLSAALCSSTLDVISVPGRRCIGLSVEETRQKLQDWERTIAAAVVRGGFYGVRPVGFLRKLNMMSSALALLLFSLHALAFQALEQVRPHLTGCISPSMETFHCRWSVGSFQNLSEPRDLRLFYFNRLPLTTSETNWSECPLYSSERPDECFFNENHTTIWTSYNVQLRSRDQSVLYDEISFSVPDIVE